MRQLADFALLLNGVLAGLLMFDAARVRTRGGKVTPRLRFRLLIPLGVVLMGIGQRLAYGYGAVTILSCLVCLAGIGCVIAALLAFREARGGAQQYGPMSGGKTP